MPCSTISASPWTGTEVATLAAVLREHTGRLLAIPGVVGIAEGARAGQPCVKVFVVARTAELVRQLPATLEGYAVVIEATGGLEAREVP